MGVPLPPYVSARPVVRFWVASSLAEVRQSHWVLLHPGMGYSAPAARCTACQLIQWGGPARQVKEVTGVVRKRDKAASMPHGGWMSQPSSAPFPPPPPTTPEIGFGMPRAIQAQAFGLGAGWRSCAGLCTRPQRLRTRTCGGLKPNPNNARFAVCCLLFALRGRTGTA